MYALRQCDAWRVERPLCVADVMCADKGMWVCVLLGYRHALLAVLAKR